MIPKIGNRKKSVPSSAGRAKSDSILAEKFMFPFKTNKHDIRFYREGKEWYADIPEYINSGGRKSDLLMVDGADTLLEKLSGKNNHITLRISKKKFKEATISMRREKTEKREEIIAYESRSENDEGVWYEVLELNGKTSDHKFWLCPVTVYVFGDFPEEIFAEVVG